MEKFYFEKPSLERKDEIIEYLDEFKKYGSDINGSGGLDMIYDGLTIEESIDRCLKMEDEEYARSIDRCPGKTFLLIREDDDKIVGTINLRWTHNDVILKHGHIGYGVRPTERRKGYNKINLYMVLQEAKKIGLDRVMLTCYVENLGSNSTIKALGGVLEKCEKEDDKLLNVYWIDVDESIEKYKDVYEPYISKNIKLIPYTDDDYEFVYEVKKNAYKKYVEECWGSWIDEDQRQYFDKFINIVKDNTYIIMDDDKKIGFYNGEVLENDDYEIGNICIISEYQGKGIGTKILNNILKENNDKNIKIQYFKQNPVGELYKRLGFVYNGETEFHYQMIKLKK